MRLTEGFKSEFDFSTYIYEVSFEVVPCNFLERIFSRRKGSTKKRYYIARVPRYTSLWEEGIHV